MMAVHIIIGIGSGALYSNTGGSANVAIGELALPVIQQEIIILELVNILLSIILLVFKYCIRI